jgi:hypothetical protein
VYNKDMTFPYDLLRFLYWIFFKPISLHAQIDRLGPNMENTSMLLTRSHDRPAQSFKSLALFYILIVPPLLGLGTGALLSQRGIDVNWLKLVFYLVVAIALSSSFSIYFCIAFLLPFSVMVALWSSLPFTTSMGVTFSLMLGLAYGLRPKSVGWGLTAGLIYGVVLGLILTLLDGLLIGAAFLTGYFRIIFYFVEAPLSWILGTLAKGGNALRLWRIHPVLWDEVIWLPLPRLDRHLLEIQRQNGPASGAAILHVRESFRQKWAAVGMMRNVESGEQKV